jgi:type II secretory pathway pseudopilin PulG
MKPNITNVNNSSGLTKRSPLKKGKIVTAVGLIVIMAFMWGRVIINRKASKNEAKAATIRATQEAQATQQQKQPDVKITFVQLPVVPGRNDVLTHDIFTAKKWKGFPAGTDTGTSEVTLLNDNEYINKIAKTITLDAIIAGQNPEAFIQSQLVSVGSKLHVNYNDQIYEFTVAEIHETKVVLRLNDFAVDIKMSQSN